MNPPANEQAEIAVLSAIMYDDYGAPDALQLLGPESFSMREHTEIFRAIKVLSDDGSKIDIVTVSAEAKRQGSKVTASFISSQLVPGYTDCLRYAQIVAEHAIRRSVISGLGLKIQRAYDDTEDVFEILADTEAEIQALNDHGSLEHAKGLDHVLGNVIEHLERAQGLNDSGIVGVTGVSSGFVDLDRILSGWQATDMICLAARPSVGKSALASQFAYNAAKHGIPSVIFSLEMNAEQIAQRILGPEAGVDMMRARRGQLDALDWERIHGSVADMSSTPLFIDDRPGITVSTMRSSVRRLRKKYGVGIVVIDYLQLMSAGRQFGSREQEISFISRSMKHMAKELKIPVIALSQLNRSVEQRGQFAEPRLSDLRESGAIEQDSDIVLFLNKVDEHGDLMLNVAKHRNGSLGKVPLSYLPNSPHIIAYDPGVEASEKMRYGSR